jgi:hypothetical protein
MADRAEAEREVRYDIQLRRRPPESLRSRYPSMTVRTTHAQTALRRRICGPGQLDALLQDLRSVGLVLTDVHRLPPGEDDLGDADRPALGAGATEAQSTMPATYEVRVSGELGDPMLRYLRCSHYVVPEQTLVQVAVASTELNRFLQACQECGASIERVRRVDPTTG